MPRKKKCPRTNKENPDRQGVMPRTTLSSADQDHERRRCHATKGSLLERPNGKPECHRPAIGAWRSSDPRKGRHLHIKYPQLTSLPHCRRRDPWTVLSRSQQLTEHQKEQLMGRALKCGQGWLTGVGSGWIEKKPYKVKDLLRGKGEGASGREGGEKETQVPPSCLWWIEPDGSSYHWARSSFPRTVSPSIPVFLIPTRPSPLSMQAVVSSKPSSWTRSLQIHCNGSAWPRSHLSMGPSLARKTWTPQITSLQ